MTNITPGGQTLLSLFDMIYVINLPERRDRRQQMEEQLARLGLDFDHPKITLFSAFRPDNAGEFPTIGCRGCFESQLAVFEDALNAGHSRFLVLEDDANFAAGFEAMITETKEFLEGREWDILYGYSPELAPVVDLGPLRIVDPEVAVRCSHFLSFNHAAAKKALPYLRGIYERPMNHPDGGAMHVDGAFGWFRNAHPEFVTYASKKSLAVQRSSLSNIHPPLWYERIEPFASVLMAARRLKAKIR